MSEPLSFDSATPRYALPLLFAGQSQKEFYVNEAHALADALLHCAVEGLADAPPPDPAEGACWLVGDAPTDAWAGQAGKLACRQPGGWLFVAPRDGMSLLDRASGQTLRYRGGWIAPAAPAAPTGGTTIDAELRAASAFWWKPLPRLGFSRQHDGNRRARPSFAGLGRESGRIFLSQRAHFATFLQQFV